MKKRVRITPPKNNNPFNPMNQWMAQMGGVQSTPQVNDDQLLSVAAQMLVDGLGTDEVFNNLLSSGVDAIKANEILGSLVQYVNDQEELKASNALNDEYTAEQLLAEQMAGEAVAQEEEDAARQAQLEQMYYADSDQGQYDDSEFMDTVIAKYGGSKNSFVKNVMKLVKKQMGGEDGPSSANSTDTGAREGLTQNFLQSVKSNAEEAQLKQQLEDTYDSYMQFGGSRGQQRRMNRRMNRMIGQMPMGFFNAKTQMFPQQMNFNMLPNMLPTAGMVNYPGMNMMPGNIQLANIDVRRTGLFGRPKEYTINFATTPVSQINPTEVVKQEVENTKTQIEDAKKEEKQKETTTSTENTNVKEASGEEEVVTADQITVTDGKKKPAAGTKPVAGKKDKWGRTPDDKWYGFDPETKQYTEKDKWGRDPGSKWYGFDPKTKTYTTAKPKSKSLPQSQQELFDNAFALKDPSKPKSTESEYVEPGTWQSSDFARYANQGNTSNNIFSKTKGLNSPASLWKLGLQTVASNPNAARAFNTAIDETNNVGYQMNRPVREFLQQGGFTDGTLYKFIYGGDDPSIPFLDESFRTNSKDVTDPYFQDGGYVELYDKSGKLIKTVTSEEAAANKAYDQYTQKDVTKSTNTNTPTKDNYNTITNYNYPGYNQVGPIYPPLFGGRRRGMGRQFGPGFWNPAIQYAGSWAKQMGPAYDPATGKPITGIVNPQVHSIDVRKSGMWGQPKKYTINFMGDTPGGGFGSFDKARRDALTGNTNPYMSNTGDRWGNKDARVQDRWRRRSPETDWSTEDVHISPKDLQTVGTLPTKKATTIEASSANQARAEQDQKLNPPTPTMATRKAQPIETRRAPQELASDPSMYFNAPTDTETGVDQIVDVQPEDLSQYANQFANVDNLPIRRPYSEEQAQMFQNFAPYIGGDPYSTIADLNSMDVQNFEMQRLMDQDRASNQFASNMANYDFGNPNIPIAERPVVAQRNPVTPGRSSIQVNPTRNENVVVNQQGRNKQLPPDQQKIFNRIVQINNLLLQHQPESIKEMLLEERNRLARGDASFSPANVYRQYGGDLPKAQTLGEFNSTTPFKQRNTDFNLNASLDNPYDLDKSYANPLTGESPAIRMGNDGEYVNEGVLTDKDKEALNKQMMSVDAKTKNMWNLDFPMLLNQFNAGVGFGTNVIDAFRNRNIQDQMNQNLTADNLYNINQLRDRGTYESNSGLFRPDQMGFTGVAKQGGQKEGSVTFMSQKQINDFLANGGEIEFI